MNEILLLGRGISNNALKEFMDKFQILYDYLDIDRVERYNYHLVIKGPGVYYQNEVVKKFIELGVKVITDVEFISWFLNREYIGITGTNGKTSTTLLLTDMIKKKYSAIACGNCGFPISQAALDYKLFHYFVLELSSFQLKGCINFTPKIAIVTNIKQAHLDYHETLKDYYESKFNITKNQSKLDYLILNFDCENTMNLFKNSIATKLTYSLNNKNCDAYVYKNKVYYKREKICNVKNKSITMRYNILSSVCAAKLLDIPNKLIKKSIIEFKEIKYRLEKIKKNIYNDAKSTNIYSTIAAINQFKGKSIYLICGGYDRKEDISALENHLEDIKAVFVYGATSDKVTLYCKKRKIEVYSFNNLKDATISVLNKVKTEIILYSPMFASYDQYSSFEQRGKEFNTIVNEYYHSFKR